MSNFNFLSNILHGEEVKNILRNFNGFFSDVHKNVFISLYKETFSFKKKISSPIMIYKPSILSIQL